MRFVICARDPRVVDVKKLRTVYDFCSARATLCGDSRGRCYKKTEDILRFSIFRKLRTFIFNMPERPSAQIGVVDIEKLGTFTILNLCARPSAEIGVVDVEKRRTFCDDRRGRSAVAAAPCEFAKCPTNPLRGSCVSKRSRRDAVRICCLRTGLWKWSRGLRPCTYIEERLASTFMYIARNASPFLDGSSA